MKVKFRLYWMVEYSPEVHVYESLGVTSYNLIHIIYEPSESGWNTIKQPDISYENPYEGYDGWDSI